EGIPATPTWESARGPHRLFKRPPDLEHGGARLVIDGIEFLGLCPEKQQAARVPPTRHEKTGVPRRWLPGLSIHDVPVAELPENVGQRMREAAGGSKGGRKPSVAGDGVLTEGQRNDELFKLGCGMKRLGMSENIIAVALLATNTERCEPPLSEKE